VRSGPRPYLYKVVSHHMIGEVNNIAAREYLSAQCPELFILDDRDPMKQWYYSKRQATEVADYVLENELMVFESLECDEVIEDPLRIYIGVYRNPVDPDTGKYLYRDDDAGQLNGKHPTGEPLLELHKVLPVMMNDFSTIPKPKKAKTKNGDA